jgi:branched-chain amino acid transport system substrate-binding protein
VFPDEGRYAASGTDSERGVDLAAEQVNAEGGVHGRTLEVLHYRTGSFIADAAAAVERAIEDGVLAIVGPNSSDLASVMAERAEQAGVLMVSNVATSPEVTRGRRFVFRVCYTDARLGELLARFACEKLGARRVAALFEVSRFYSYGLAQAFLQRYRLACPEGGARGWHYLENEVDFEEPLRSLQAWDPDAAILPGSTTDVSLIGAAMGALGLRATLIGGDSWSRGQLFPHGGPVRPSFHSDHWNPGDPALAPFLEAYRARHGGAPQGARSVLAADAVEGLRQALTRLGPLPGEALGGPRLAGTRGALRDAFQAVDYAGYTGRIRFPSGGDPEKGCHLFRVDCGPDGKTPPRSEYVGTLP